MDQALSWVGDIVRALLQFIPRLLIVRSTHRGVKWPWGRRPKEMKPGIHMFWPVFTECEKIVVARQTQDIPPQVLTTSDGHSVAVGAFATYGIRDVVLAIGERNWDVDGTVKEICAAAISQVIGQHTFDQLSEEKKTGQLEKRLTSACRKKLRKYGVGVHSCCVTDFAKCRVYRVIGGMTS